MEQKFGKNSIDIKVLREFCEREGKMVEYRKGEQLEREGESAQWMAFVKRGCFKYMVHNDEEDKDYCIKDYFLPRGIGMKYSNP